MLSKSTHLPTVAYATAPGQRLLRSTTMALSGLRVLLTRALHADMPSILASSESDVNRGGPTSGSTGGGPSSSSSSRPSSCEESKQSFVWNVFSFATFVWVKANFGDNVGWDLLCVTKNLLVSNHCQSISNCYNGQIGRQSTSNTVIWWSTKTLPLIRKATL